MKNRQQLRQGQSHLYDPKKEGIGKYDVHYINAYKKSIENIKGSDNKKFVQERYAA